MNNNASYTMMAKLIRALEFHNPMIQSLRMPIVAPYTHCCLFTLLFIGLESLKLSHIFRACEAENVKYLENKQVFFIKSALILFDRIVILQLMLTLDSATLMIWLKEMIEVKPWILATLKCLLTM